MIGRKFSSSFFNMSAAISISLLLSDDYHFPTPAMECEFKGDPKCKTDHGERTNKKLVSQPFYHRSNNGKMKGY